MLVYLFIYVYVYLYISRTCSWRRATTTGSVIEEAATLKHQALVTCDPDIL